MKRAKPVYYTNQRLLEHSLANNHPKLAIYYTMVMGDSARAAGNFLQAEKFYQQGIDIATSIQGKKSERIFAMRENIFEPYVRLGNLYTQTNNLRKAENILVKGMEIKDHYLPRFSVFRTSTYIALGKVSFKKGDIKGAMNYFEQAEKVLNRATTTSYDYGIPRRDILSNKFEIFMEQKDYRQAKKYVDRLSTGGRLGSVGTSEQIPLIFEQKARYYLEIGEYKEAHEYIKKAKLYSRYLKLSLVSMKIQRTEALLYWAESNIEQAARGFYILITGYKDHILKSFPSMSEYEREAFYATFRADFDLYNSFVIQNQNFSGYDRLVQVMYDNQLFIKALLLNEINKIKNGIKQSNNVVLRSQLQEWEQQKAKLSSLYFQKKVSPAVIRSTEERIITLEQELSRQSRLLNAVESSVSWKKVAGALREQEAAVEVIRVRDFKIDGEFKFRFANTVTYAALIIDQQTTKPLCQLIVNGNDLETKYLKYYRNSIAVKTEDTLSYTIYWKPIKQSLTAYKKIYLSLDGAYNQINLSTLQNPQNQKYLVDELDFSVVTNTKDLLLKGGSTQAQSCSLYGRPDYKVSTTGAIRSSGNNERSVESEIMEGFREQSFDDLPGTEVEVDHVSQIISKYGWHPTIRAGGQATEDNIKAEKNPTVLHVATHGFFLNGENLGQVNSMVRSGIILSGINAGVEQAEDGVLTAYESTSLNLDSTYLVVLSACETGLGEIKNGEGVYGLQRGFTVAGAKYLLMSLWKVDDEATSLLMENFYAEWLKGSSIHEAVKQAQATVRAKYPEPYYWGSFILLGI